MFQLFGRMSQFGWKRAGAAAFPVIETTSNGTTAATATADATLPTGIANGNMLIAIVSVGGGTLSTPSGWTQLFTAISSVVNRVSVFYRVADGSEGSTLSITSANSTAKRYAIYRISNFNGNPFGTGSNSGGTNGDPNPPNQAAPAGTDKILWFAIGYQSNINALPTNYSSGLSAVPLMVGTRQLEAASEDPGTFGTSSPTIWTAGTVGLRGL